MKEQLAHSAQHHLQSRTSTDVSRSHVYELLAAALGARSWAAFLGDSVLADAGVGEAPVDAVPLLVGRALQLGYPQGLAVKIAEELLEFMRPRQLCRVRWTEMYQLCMAPRRPDPIDDWDDGDATFDDDGPAQSADAPESADAIQQRLLGSGLLIASLELAEGLSPERHHAIAGLFRCTPPNSYLYEESLKWRLLTGIERDWVDDYKRMEPQFRKYEAHLKAAAHGGVRAAAVECAAVFSAAEFFDLAERLPGPVDAERMAELATSPDARERWMRVAADEGSESALRHLAIGGDPSARERLAASGDVRSLRRLVEEAIESGDGERAWTWQYLALEHGEDFTESSMRAYHDGGSQDGQFYDSDFGGRLFVDGVEALDLPEIDAAEHEGARKTARELYVRYAGVQLGS